MTASKGSSATVADLPYVDSVGSFTCHPSRWQKIRVGSGVLISFNALPSYDRLAFASHDGLWLFV
eukprot:scaffold1393_cov37-Attheya_sp.AAC.1